MTPVRFPFPRELDEWEAEFDDEPPKSHAQMMREALDRLAVPDALGVTAAESFARETPGGAIIGWFLIVLMALSAVFFASLAWGDELRAETPPTFFAEAGKYTDMVWFGIHVEDGKDEDMCVMGATMPPTGDYICVVQYKAGGTLVFPRGFAITIIRPSR